MLGRCSRHSTYTLTERDLLAALKCERPDNTAVEIQGYSQHDRNAVCARTVSLSRRLAFRLPVAFWDLFGFCFLFSRQARFNENLDGLRPNSAAGGTPRLSEAAGALHDANVVRTRAGAGGASAGSPRVHESGSEHEDSDAEDELGGQEDPETERTVRGYGIGKEYMLFRRLMVEDGEPAGPSSRAPILSTRPTRACIVTTASSASCLRKKIRRRSTAQTR